MTPLLSRLLLASGLALSAFGCGSSPDAQETEGLQLLAAIGEVRAVTRQNAEYRAAVGALKALRPTDERVARIQQICVEAHERVFQAEDEADNARRLAQEHGFESTQTREAVELGTRLILEAEQQVGRCGAMSTALGVSIGYEEPEER